jgi:hypothetical protein
MQSLPVGPYRYKSLRRFASKYTRAPARGERVGRTLAMVLATRLQWLAGCCYLGCIHAPSSGTGGPTVITVHAGSRLRSPRRLGREKHQQREAGKRGQLTNRDRGAPARRRLGGAPTNPRRPNEVGCTGCQQFFEPSGFSS